MPKKVARDVMTTEVLTVRADWYLDRLAEFLIEHGISGAPVLDETDDVVGVISLSDLVRHRADASTEVPEEPGLFFQEPLDTRLSKADIETLGIKQLENVTAEQLMTRAVFSVDEDTPVSEIAGAMLQGRVHRVLVTKDSKISGIISSLDLLRLLLDD